MISHDCGLYQFLLLITARLIERSIDHRPCRRIAEHRGRRVARLDDRQRRRPSRQRLLPAAKEAAAIGGGSGDAAGGALQSMASEGTVGRYTSRATLRDSFVPSRVRLSCDCLSNTKQENLLVAAQENLCTRKMR